MPPLSHIIIVGAGPSGLLLACLLARGSIRVTVLEQELTLPAKPRATHFLAPAIAELRRAGVLPEVRSAGFTPSTICWRTLDGRRLAGMRPPEGDDAMVCLPLDRLGAMLEKQLGKCESAEVRYGKTVVDVGQDAGLAWVEVNDEGGERTRMAADYVVGCDGANSIVRRSLFGEDFPGKTWDEQLVATDVYYDFHKYGYEDTNNFIHPEHYHVVSRITRDGLWRVTYGDGRIGLTHDELLARQPAKFAQILPGSDTYTLANISPYRVHQRLAPAMRVGRLLLAADAAHLCNPFGGMGLTGGIVDVGGLYDCLVGIHRDLCGEEILDVYSAVRRRKWEEEVDKVSTMNMRLLIDVDPERALEDSEVLQRIKKAEGDPRLVKEMQDTRTSALRYDFTAHYNYK